MRGLVIKTTGLWYSVYCEGEIYNARLRGKFRKMGIKTTNPIAVGDEVEIDVEENENEAITKIYERQNYVIRKSTKLSAQAHMIASNIDQALLIVTLKEPRTSLGFIDRFLVTTESFRIPVIIAFNKSDLLDEDDKEYIEALSMIYTDLGYTCLNTSIVSAQNIDVLGELMKHKTTLITGHSGVGKSSLLNCISPHLELKTGDISKVHAKGKHTTTFSEMHFIDEDTRIIDTPGIKEIGLYNIEKNELAHYFIEMRGYLGQCKFNNCTHTHEPKCIIREKVEEGYIANFRYENYLAILEGEDMNDSKFKKS